MDLLAAEGVKERNCLSGIPTFIAIGSSLERLYPDKDGRISELCTGGYSASCLLCARVDESSCLRFIPLGKLHLSK